MQAAAALQRQKQDPDIPSQRDIRVLLYLERSGRGKRRMAPDRLTRKNRNDQLSTMAFTASMRSTT